MNLLHTHTQTQGRIDLGMIYFNSVNWKNDLKFSVYSFYPFPLLSIALTFLLEEFVLFVVVDGLVSHQPFLTPPHPPPPQGPRPRANV